MTTKKPDEPPQPPPFQRRIAIAPVQAIGVGVMLLIVAAALLGWLGLAPGEAHAERGALQVQVNYPHILRYKTAMPLEIRLTNTGTAELPAMSLKLDRDYLDDFQDVRLTPEPARITERHVEVALPALPAGQTQQVVAWLEAHERGRRKAALQVSGGGATALDVEWSTLVLP